MTDDLWTPDDPEILKVVHPDAKGVTGMARDAGHRAEPVPHRFRPYLERRYRGLGWYWRCLHCGGTYKQHRDQNRRDRAELRRRKGKVASECPRCLSTGDYVDERGRNGWRSCPRCDGWGRLWEER